MTHQEIINKVAAAMRSQGRISLHPVEGVCAYRADADNSNVCCAIGHLIPASIYVPEMECQDVSELCHNFPEVADNIFGEQPLDLQFLDRIQSDLHDQYQVDVAAAKATSYSAWFEVQLRDFCKLHGLVFPPKEV